MVPASMSSTPWYSRFAFVLVAVVFFGLALGSGFIGLLVGIDEPFAARPFHGAALVFGVLAFASLAAGVLRLLVSR